LEAFATNIDSPRTTHESSNGIWFVSETSLPSYSVEEVAAGFEANKNLVIKSEKIDESGHKIILSREESLQKVKEAINVVEGANLVHNEYGNRLFADFFFFITGFHGFHVFSGVVINIIIFFNVIMGTYEKRGHYEMVEKVGLYWHFVDLVWVFVFTFFYLV
jgi:cytochrome c oxidase subunit 3